MQSFSAKLQHARPASCVSARTLTKHVPAIPRPFTSTRPSLRSKTSSWLLSEASESFHLTAARYKVYASATTTSASSTVTVTSNWNADIKFSPAKIVSNAAAANALHQITIDIGPLASGYTKPGQFVQVKVNDSKPGFFAIASAPDSNNQGVVELLIKSQPGSTAELLCGALSGDEVLVSPVMGKGFPVDQIPASQYSTVLLFATGSGISPVKALIESGALEAGKRSDVRLYYGTRTAETTAYQDKVPEWQAAGVSVIQVFSESQGYVQDVFAADTKLAEPAKVGIVLCGHKGMCEAVKTIAAEAGVDSSKILLNF